MSNTPAGWLPDPERPGQLRYWDGEAWGPQAPPTSGDPTNQQPPRRRTTKVWLLPVLACAALLIVAVVAGALLSTSSSVRDAVKSATSDTTTPAPEPGTNDESRQHLYTAGQTALTSGFEVTLDAVTDPWRPSDPTEAALPGHRLVAVELTLVNTSSDSATFLSPVQVEASDALGRPWASTPFIDPLPSLDGDVPALGKRRGWVVIEVGDDASGLQLRVKGSITATGSVFQL